MGVASLKRSITFSAASKSGSKRQEQSQNQIALYLASKLRVQRPSAAVIDKKFRLRKYENIRTHHGWKP